MPHRIILVETVDAKLSGSIDQLKNDLTELQKIISKISYGNEVIQLDQYSNGQTSILGPYTLSSRYTINDLCHSNLPYQELAKKSHDDGIDLSLASYTTVVTPYQSGCSTFRTEPIENSQYPIVRIGGWPSLRSLVKAVGLHVHLNENESNDQSADISSVMGFRNVLLANYDFSEPEKAKLDWLPAGAIANLVNLEDSSLQKISVSSSDTTDVLGQVPLLVNFYYSKEFTKLYFSFSRKDLTGVPVILVHKMDEDGKIKFLSAIGEGRADKIAWGSREIAVGFNGLVAGNAEVIIYPHPVDTVSDLDSDGVEDSIDCAPLDSAKSAIGTYWKDIDQDNHWTSIILCNNRGYDSLPAPVEFVPAGGAEGDNCPSNFNPEQIDVNQNLVGDICEPGNNDFDSDGVVNELDCDPSDPLKKKMAWIYYDADGDGIGNVALNTMTCIGDSPVNGIIVDPNGADNCPYAANLDQKDTDQDGAGDACDPDIDGDGILNDVDCSPYTPSLIRSFGFSDEDHDGFVTSRIKVALQCELGGSNTTGYLGKFTSLDNCPTIANVNQEDSDSNSGGDVCDLDFHKKMTYRGLDLIEILRIKIKRLRVARMRVSSSAAQKTKIYQLNLKDTLTYFNRFQFENGASEIAKISNALEVQLSKMLKQRMTKSARNVVIHSLLKKLNELEKILSYDA